MLMRLFSKKNVYDRSIPMNLRFEEEQKRQRRIALAKEGGRFLIEILIVILIAWLIITFALKKASVIGSSMETTLYNGEDVIVNKMSYLLFSPRREQVIAFYPESEEEGDLDEMDDTNIMIRRVIGLPGEKVQIKDGKVWINGETIAEKYPFELMNSAGKAMNEIQLENDEYFVLSDNRNDMDDSRNSSFTRVRKKNIIGKVVLRLNPFSLLGGPEIQKEET